MLLIWVDRQQASLLATRAVVQAVVASEGSKDAVEAFEQYCVKMFPFYENATKLEQEEEKKALLELVKKPIRIDLSSVYKSQAEALSRMAPKPKMVKRRE